MKNNDGFPTLVDYIVENKDSLYNSDIEEVIDECIEEVKGDDKK